MKHLARLWDNNMSRWVSVTILNVGMPPFDMDASTIAAYVEQLNNIPETELREVIWQGLSEKWFKLPTTTEIHVLWREMYEPLDPMWQEVFEGDAVER